jgi:acetylornithine deacetylase/succinyl-diaminopimelate desuccinylase-like protein
VYYKVENMSIDYTVDSEMYSFIRDLQTLIRQPSVSTTKEGIVECANLVAEMMHKAGIHSEILCIDEKEADVPPLVYGEVKSQVNPYGETILFYNHYDVQPIEPIESWKNDPFSGKVEGNYIYGRGASDDKGELISRIKAVEYILKNNGDVPCNVKFVVGGEEETGSEHIEKYLINYKDKLMGCDGVIWESGIIDERDKPIIELGVKGVLSVELTVKDPPSDLHSSLAVLIENPAWRLITALNTMRDEKGNVLITDWYKEAKEFTEEEIQALENAPLDIRELKKGYGVDRLINNPSDYEAKKALAGATTCNITGLASGYTGKGIKNIILFGHYPYQFIFYCCCF